MKWERKDHSQIKRSILREYMKEHENRNSHENTWYRAVHISLPLFLEFLHDKCRKNCYHATQKDIQNFIDYLKNDYISPCRKKPLSRRTINFYLQDIKTFYKWLKESDKIQHNPAKDVKRLKVDKPDNKNKFLKPGEVLEVVEWLKENSKTPKRDIALIALMFDPWGMSGCMRMGEVLALDLDPKDVNFDEQIIHIHKTVGKTRVESSTKTHQDRDIVMTSKMKEILLDYIENERPKPKKGNPLFIGTKNNRRLEKTTLNLIFKRVEKESGLKFRCKFRSHVGRHSGITKIVNDPSCSIKYAQRTSGIREMKVLEGYAHNITDEDRRIAEGKSSTQPAGKDKAAELLEAIRANNLSDDQRMMLIKELARP